MIRYKDFIGTALELRLPSEYASFMERYANKLPDDPIREQSWLAGLGSSEFVVGTTLAFRNQVPGFSKQHLVIGYAGIKKIIVNKTYEDVDSFIALDSQNGQVFLVDSIGVTEKLADGFDEWIGPELLRTELKEKYTSALSVVVFDDLEKAQEARSKLLKLKRAGFVDLEDVVAVVKEEEGAAKISHLHTMAGKGGLAGSITGLIVGAILLHPILGAAFGAATGATSAALADVGIDDHFVTDLAAKLKPGSSALFALIRSSDSDKLMEEFQGFGGKIIITSVDRQKAEDMQSVLDTPPGEEQQR